MKNYIQMLERRNMFVPSLKEIEGLYIKEKGGNVNWIYKNRNNILHENVMYEWYVREYLGI